MLGCCCCAQQAEHDEQIQVAVAKLFTEGSATEKSKVAVQGALSTSDEPGLIMITKNRADDQMGAHFATQKSELVIMKIGEGLVKEHNANSMTGKLLPGHVIQEVNGTTGTPAELVQKLDQEKDLSIKAWRLSQFEIDVYKEKDGLFGLDCSKSTMEVKAVKQRGLIQRHNDACEPGKEVLVGDKIIQVNAVSGSAVDMLSELRSCSGTVKLSVMRS